MQQSNHSASTPTVTRRLAKAERQSQLLETALQVIRHAGAERLTRAHLAKCAGVSKPVVYDHFATRSALLIELYRWIDIDRVNAFRELMTGPLSREETAQLLASAYIQCASNNTDEFYTVGAALTGSDAKAAVFQELLDSCVQMFVSVLAPPLQPAGARAGAALHRPGRCRRSAGRRPGARQVRQDRGDQRLHCADSRRVTGRCLMSRHPTCR